MLIIHCCGAGLGKSTVLTNAWACLQQRIAYVQQHHDNQPRPAWTDQWHEQGLLLLQERMSAWGNGNCWVFPTNFDKKPGECV